MPKIEKIGTGITARSVTRYDMTGNTSGDIKAARDSFRRNQGNFGQRVSERGLFAAVTDDVRETCRDILEGEIDGAPEADSPEDFARKIMRYLEIADHNISENNSQLSARYAFQAGVAWATAAMKWDWEREAISGQKFLKKSEEGANARRGDLAEHTPAVLAEMGKLIDAGQTAASAARIVAARGIGTSAEANRGLWQRHKKKPVTHP